MSAAADVQRYVALAADGTRVAIEVCADEHVPGWRALHDNESLRGLEDDDVYASASAALAMKLTDLQCEHGRPIVEVLREGAPSRVELLAALRELMIATTDYCASDDARDVRPERTLVALQTASRLLAATEVRDG